MTKANSLAGLLVLAALILTGCASRAEITTHRLKIPVRVGPVKRLGGSAAAETANPYKPFLATVARDGRLIYIGAGAGGVGAGAASYKERESDSRQVDKILESAIEDCTAPCAADVKFVHASSIGTFAPLVIYDFKTVSILGTVTHAGPTGEAFLEAEGSETEEQATEQPTEAAAAAETGASNTETQEAGNE